jgi:hypothetical protein
VIRLFNPKKNKKKLTETYTNRERKREDMVEERENERKIINK